MPSATGAGATWNANSGSPSTSRQWHLLMSGDFTPPASPLLRSHSPSRSTSSARKRRKISLGHSECAEPSQLTNTRLASWRTSGLVAHGGFLRNSQTCKETSLAGSFSPAVPRASIGKIRMPPSCCLQNPLAAPRRATLWPVERGLRNACAFLASVACCIAIANEGQLHGTPYLSARFAAAV